MGNKYVEIVKDTECVSMKTSLKSIISSGLTEVGVQNKEAFSILKQGLVEKLNSITDEGVWKDMTSTTIQNETISGIDNIIAKFEKPIDTVMLTIGGHVEELGKVVDYYDISVDDYNELVKKYNNMSKPSESTFTVAGVLDTYRYNNAVSSWNSSRSSYESKMDSLKTKIDESKTHLDSVLETIKGLMSPEGMYDGVDGYPPFDYDGINLDDIVEYQEPEDLYTERELTPAELEEFRETHCIREGDDITVYETIRIINGVAVKIYYVHTDLYDYDEDFRVYGEECVEQLSKMDSVVLKYLTENGTDLVMLEDALISKYNSTGYVGLYWPGTKIVQMRYPGSTNHGGWSEGVIHEFGHAFDHAITGENVGYLSCCKPGDPYYPESIVEDLLTDSNNDVKYWEYLIDKECGAMFPCDTPENTQKNVENTKNTPSEYIAELIKRYYVSEESRERMKAVAPESYEAIERMIKYVERKQGEGNEN